MRIISGKFKGKKIFNTKSLNTRPLRDYVKENIFNILTHGKFTKFNFEKAHILDLYAGIGSFGIECLSRNVGQVVFVEKDPLAFSLLKKNVNDLKLSNKVKLINQDVKMYLEKFKGKEKFDLIFLDPPYKNNTFFEVISLFKEKKIFNEFHKIIVHREIKSEENLNKYFKIELEKNYGRSKIIFGSF